MHKAISAEGAIPGQGRAGESNQPQAGFGQAGEFLVVRQVAGEVGRHGGVWPDRGMQVEMEPEHLSSEGPLSEVGSPSEASHPLLSDSASQQPHPRSHSHCCPWTRQAPRRGRAC